ncbi:MAG: hypothetical protein NT099_01770 [Candidatus Saganbacteria bacterium]|nr:hypothetical protein [Candidatus Saganbacteria bacterium]
MVNKLKIKKDTRLYKFLMNGNGSGEKIYFDITLFQEALEALARINDPDIFFEFEDRLINEIIDLAKHGNPDESRKEIMRICAVVESHINHAKHVAPLIDSIRNCTKSAARAAMYCL